MQFKTESRVYNTDMAQKNSFNKYNSKNAMRASEWRYLQSTDMLSSTKIISVLLFVDDRYDLRPVFTTVRRLIPVQTQDFLCMYPRVYYSRVLCGMMMMSTFLKAHSCRKLQSTVEYDIYSYIFHTKANQSFQ